MKKIKRFWNIVYYGIYNFDVYLRNLIGYINPFNIINNVKSVKEFHSRHGVSDMRSMRNRILGNRKTGISNIRSSSLIGGIIVLIEYGIFNIFQAVSGISLVMNLWKNAANFIMYLILFVGPALLINNFLLFRNDEYLNYFNEFDKLDKRKKRAYFLVSLISILFIVLFFFLSFYFIK